MSVSGAPNPRRGGRTGIDKEIAMWSFCRKLTALFNLRPLAPLVAALAVVSLLAGCVVYAEPPHVHYWHEYGWR